VMLKSAATMSKSKAKAIGYRILVPFWETLD
jgi:hypothetical protein